MDSTDRPTSAFASAEQADEQGSERQSRTRQRAAARLPLGLGMAHEMARLINEALVRARLAQAEIVGEARRGKETMPELSMITKGPADRGALATALSLATACSHVALSGRDTLLLHFEGGGPVRLRIVAPEHHLEALVRGTGSSRHVRWLESLAKRRGGLRRVCESKGSERALYEALGVPYAPPELRESATPHVPKLVGSVQGVFHVHTTWSDGTASIVEMAHAAIAAGLRYLGVSEHSRAAIYARGLDETRLREQAAAIEKARGEVPELTLLHGIEVDVLADGALDLPDAALAELDFVVASVHTELEMSAEQMTARLLRAVTHPLVTILGHPTGRLLPGRRGYEFDLGSVAEAAANNETFLEINANPQRLDLSDDLVRKAAARGARFAIDPDAHTTRGIADTFLGLAVARRAGLAPSQVLNASGPKAVTTYLQARRERAKRVLLLP